MNNNYKEIKLSEDLIIYYTEDIGFYYHVTKDVYTPIDPIELIKIKYYALQIEFNDMKERLENIEKILVHLTKDLRLIIS